MKSLLKMTLIGCAIVLALTGCDDKKDNSTVSQPATQTKVEAAVTSNENQAESNTKTVTDNNQVANVVSDTVANNDSSEVIDANKDAYALGASLGNYINNSLTSNNITLDNKIITDGFSDALQGKSKYTPEEINSMVTALDQRVQKEITARNEAIKALNTEAGDKFRAEFAKEKGVKQTESGLLYQIIDAGSAKHPTKDDVVTVQYTGTLIDGQKFDSSYDRQDPTMFLLGQVIPGWVEGIQLIGVGGKIKLVIPPNLAYGDQSMPAQPGYAAITPGSTLVFEVELSDIYDDSKVPQTYDEENTK